MSNSPPVPARVGAPRRDALYLLAAQIRRGRRLVRLIERGEGADAERTYRDWRRYTEQLLHFLLPPGQETIPAPRQLGERRRGREVVDAALLNELRTRLLEVECLAEQIGRAREAIAAPSLPAAPGGRVLIVHGRNETAREKLARFLVALGLQPVVVAEEPGRGRTLIEKLEAEASLAFAVVLLTGDDVGGLDVRPRRLRSRARQNVIFELGFAVGKLGRDRVYALYEPGVELPSDYRGVEYTPLDEAGAWRTKLAKELHVAGLPFDPLRAL